MAGEVDEAKGRIQGGCRALTDDQGLKTEGKVDKATGGGTSSTPSARTMA